MSNQAGDEPGHVEEVSPPWGSIPIEAYLLHHWDASSPKGPDEQRKDLVRDYLKSGYHDISTIPPTTPTPHQIATILQPWRTIFQRDIATNPGQIGCIWLRTFYDDGTDEQHDSLLQDLDLFNAIDDEDRLLDGDEFYAFGDHWQQILDIMPELVICTDTSLWQSMQQHLQKAEDDLVKAKAYLAGEDVEGAPVELINNTRAVLPAANVESTVLGLLRSKVHKACVMNYFIVEDKEALETRRLLLVFLDMCGRVVRQSRVGPEEAEQMGGFWLNASWDEVDEWADAEIGADYQEGGVCGHLLHV